jgi:hypothetical protein
MNSIERLAGGFSTSTVMPENQASVRRITEEGRAIATLNVEMDPPARRLRYNCGAGRGEFIVDADLETAAVTLRDCYHKHFTTEEAGWYMLNKLMESQF